MEMGADRLLSLRNPPARIGKKETFRLILSSGLDCFSQRQEPGNAGSAENGKRRKLSALPGAQTPLSCPSRPAPLFCFTDPFSERTLIVQPERSRRYRR